MNPPSAESTPVLEEPEAPAVVALSVPVPADAGIDFFTVAPVLHEPSSVDVPVRDGVARFEVPFPGAYTLKARSNAIQGDGGEASVVSASYFVANAAGDDEMQLVDKRLAPGRRDWGVVYPLFETRPFAVAFSDATFEAKEAGKDLAEVAAQFAAQIRATQDEPERTMKTVHWLGFYAQFAADDDDPMTIADLQWALDAVPLDHEIWAVAPHDLMNIVYVLDKAGSTPDIEELVASTPYPSVASMLLTMKLELRAEQMSDDEKIAALERIDDLQPSGWASDFAHAMHDPRRPWAVGQPLPEFDLERLDPKPGTERIRREDIAGKPSLVVFWSETCGPCLAKMEELHAAYAACNDLPTKKLKRLRSAKEVEVPFLFIGWLSEPEGIRTYRDKEWPMPWEHVVLDDAGNDLARETWRVMSAPTMALVDAEGTIVADGNDLRETTILEGMRRHGICTSSP